jgi:hypothetical protein
VNSFEFSFDDLLNFVFSGMTHGMWQPIVAQNGSVCMCACVCVRHCTVSDHVFRDLQARACADETGRRKRQVGRVALRGDLAA